MAEYKFPDFDTSYWRKDDKDWMADRVARWPELEAMLKYEKPSKGRAIIKQYFLRGKLPDWDKLRHWGSYSGHLDLFLFLWMHPSHDKDFLKQLRDQFCQSIVIKARDIRCGFGDLFSPAIVMACQPYTDEEVDGAGLIKNVLYIGENEFYFDVLMEDIEYLDKDLEFLYLDDYPPEKISVRVPTALFDWFTLMARWLCIEKMRKPNEDMLFQYDQPLEWWYNCRERNENYFAKVAQKEARRENYRKALYRIHNFNTEKEGDTCRTRFVHKMRKILDEREFISEFKQMWEDVKAGKVEVGDPWKW